MSKPIKVILFDAANTLIYKPSLYSNMLVVFQKFSYDIDEEKLQYHHKLLSEIINFPDRTSREFYKEFNAELLLSLGIIPTEELLNELFSACSYLEWKAFGDVMILDKIETRKAVLSNFNNTLKGLLDQLIGENIFSDFIISENETHRKPSVEFYELAVNRLDIEPNEILYIGDSLKLDIIPAKKLGINTLLIDRLDIFSNYKERISNMNDIVNYL